MASEKSAHAELKRILPPGALVQRVENSVGPGTPDVFIQSQGRTAWAEDKEGVYSVEKKHVRVPKDKLRSSQYAWLVQYCYQGGVGLIGVHCESLRHTFIVEFTAGRWNALKVGVDTEFFFRWDEQGRALLQRSVWT